MARKGFQETLPSEVAAAYRVVGNQSDVCLRNMIRALGMMTWLNGPVEQERLLAAQTVLNYRKQQRRRATRLRAASPRN